MAESIFFLWTWSPNFRKTFKLFVLLISLFAEALVLFVLKYAKFREMDESLFVISIKKLSYSLEKVVRSSEALSSNNSALKMG